VSHGNRVCVSVSITLNTNKPHFSSQNVKCQENVKEIRILSNGKSCNTKRHTFPILKYYAFISLVFSSAEYDESLKICKLSREDRRTQPSAFRRQHGATVDYFENQCVKRELRETFSPHIFLKSMHSIYVFIILIDT